MNSFISRHRRFCVGVFSRTGALVMNFLCKVTLCKHFCGTGRKILLLNAVAGMFDDFLIQHHLSPGLWFSDIGHEYFKKLALLNHVIEFDDAVSGLKQAGAFVTGQ